MSCDRELLELRQKIVLKKQLEVKLNDLRGQRRIFDRKVIELRVEHRSEQGDVEKLEGRSLANYFYQVVGKLDDKLTEERKQAAAAKVKLDAALRELDAIEGDIRDIQAQLSDLYGCEKAYSAALEHKRERMKASDSPVGSELLEIEESIAFLESRKKEIREAQRAGDDALRTARSVLSELDDADSWNTWDMIGGGGIITHMAKHGHLDDAQNMVELLQGQLRDLKTELADINVQADMQVNVDGFLRFADYFFDGLFADWTVGDRISESQASVNAVVYQVENALDRLLKLEQRTDSEIKNLKAKIEELVLHA